MFSVQIPLVGNPPTRSQRAIATCLSGAGMRIQTCRHKIVAFSAAGSDREFPWAREANFALMADSSFSKRFGFSAGSREITVREAAPEGLRFTMLDEAIKSGLGPHELRRIACAVLRRRPDPGNWSEYPNVWQEVEDLVYAADWFRVYDILEAIVSDLVAPERERYRETLNPPCQDGMVPAARKT